MEIIARTIIAAIVVLSITGCVSATRHKKEIETIQYQKWQAEQENEKLKSDVVQMYYRTDLLLKDLRKQNTEAEPGITLISKQKDNSLARSLKSRGLEVFSCDSGPAVIISGIFESGSATISSNDKKRLKEAGRIIKSEVSSGSFRIDGYTDNTPGSNEKLSLKRANAAKDFLVSECAFNSKYIQTRGLGAKNPIADNKTKEGRKRNRRIEIVIVLK